MKKIISILLVLSFIIAFASCANNKSSDENSKNDANNSEITVTENENIGNNSNDSFKKSKHLVGTNYVSMKDIYYDIPDMHFIESGYADIYIDNYDKYVTFLCDWTNEVDSLEVVQDLMFPIFRDSISNSDFINELGEITGNTTTVNGIDVYAFEGVVNAGLRANRDEYIKGYTFIFEGVPCAIYGVVMDENQPQEDIDYISEVVDEMMESVRNVQ